MTQADMMQTLERLRWAFQRFRSNAREAAESKGATEAMLADMFPWIFGDRCPLKAIMICLDRGCVTGGEFYNFMTIVHNFCPEIVATSEFSFPEPDTGMMVQHLDDCK